MDLDYSRRQIYMITIAVEGRRPLLGHIESDEAAVARMVLSDLGKQVSREIEGIPRFYPQVRILGKQVMPDHLHFILFVTERLPVHLGRVINGFKVGCNRAYRRLCMPEGGASPPASKRRATQHARLAGRQREGMQCLVSCLCEAGGSRVAGGFPRCAASSLRERLP